MEEIKNTLQEIGQQKSSSHFIKERRLRLGLDEPVEFRGELFPRTRREGERSVPYVFEVQ